MKKEDAGNSNFPKIKYYLLFFEDWKNYNTIKVQSFDSNYDQNFIKMHVLSQYETEN